MLFRSMLLSPFVRQRLRGFVSLTRRDDLLTLRDLLATGAVTPALDRVFPLAEAAAAMRYLEAGQVRGKVVLRVDAGAP